jgi:hypothetical protein
MMTCLHTFSNGLAGGGRCHRCPQQNRCITCAFTRETYAGKHLVATGDGMDYNTLGNWPPINDWLELLLCMRNFTTILRVEPLPRQLVLTKHVNRNPGRCHSG